MKTKYGHSEKGFTLIEILVVVVIVGILAAIAIPQFAAYRQRSYDATSLSDLRNFKASMEGYYTDKQQYPLFASTVIPPGSTLTALDGGAISSFSQRVEGTIQSTAESFAVLTYHLSGAKVYGTASDSNTVFMESIGVNTAIVTSDASAFAGWPSL